MPTAFMVVIAQSAELDKFIFFSYFMKIKIRKEDMPICKKCDSSFPSTMVIEGKLRVLTNRVYCLTCSPFGKHNTRKLVISKTDLVCSSCNRTYIFDSLSGCTKKLCNSCIVWTHFDIKIINDR